MHQLLTDRSFRDQRSEDFDFDDDRPSLESIEVENRLIQRYQQFVHIPNNSKDCLFYV